MAKLIISEKFPLRWFEPDQSQPGGSADVRKRNKTSNEGLIATLKRFSGGSSRQLRAGAEVRSGGGRSSRETSEELNLSVWNQVTADAEDESEASDPLFFAVVRVNFTATQEDELSLREGQLVAVLETSTDGWWLGEDAAHLNGRGSIRGGWFPANNVHAIREQAHPGLNKDPVANKQVPVALVAPYVSLVAPLGANAVPKNAPEGLPKMDRLNMNFGRTFSDGRYDPVANCSWPRSGVRPGGLVTGLEPVVETVMARFSFKARGAEELSFSRGERLDILERPEDDSDWLMAANCLGQKGLVPINHLQDIDTSTNSPDLRLLPGSSPRRDLAGGRTDVASEYQHQPWFFGPISRAYSDVLLNAFGSVGDFLVRSSESSAGHLSLTVRGPGCNRHFQVHVDSVDAFRIGHRKFFHLSDLVEYYKRVPIYTTPQGYKLYLVKAFKKP